MRPSHLTERDPSLDHQVVFFVKTRQHDVHISCNCRATGGGNAAGETYDSMGITVTLDTSRRIYNDPANHAKPFGEEDQAKW